MCTVAGAGPAGEKSALARVAIVDWNGEVLLDTFVKPQEKVNSVVVANERVRTNRFDILVSFCVVLGSRSQDLGIGC